MKLHHFRAKRPSLQQRKLSSGSIFEALEARIAPAAFTSINRDGHDSGFSLIISRFGADIWLQFPTIAGKIQRRRATQNLGIVWQTLPNLWPGDGTPATLTDTQATVLRAGSTSSRFCHKVQRRLDHRSPSRRETCNGVRR